ncbi:MAG: UDPGP type 1 family protein [Phycisphaerae bacterium]|jgi:UDP-N-acetylglucosamine/UDP-N-acetylgalactosamine diphosphorylase
MDIQQRYNSTLQLLKKFNQAHLLNFFNQLDDTGKIKLLNQIDEIEFDNLNNKIQKYAVNASPFELPKNFSAAPVYPALPKTAEQKEKYAKAIALGQKIISSGKVAAFVVAGGQGTRLGFDGPKGDFAISPIKNKTLFRLFAEQIAAAGTKYKFEPAWYIMTSPLNHNQTLEIFKRDNFFGLKKTNIFFFQQGTEVNYSADGKILLAEKDELAASPDGHGGSLKAIYKNGAAADMKTRGIEYISYFQVDNPLINIFDPLFVGLHAIDNSQMSSKALTKAHPLEKVGNFCMIDGKVTVIEYSDLSDEQAQMKNADGSLLFSFGSIAIHIINRTFIEQLNAKGFALPYHRAVKKISHVDLNTGEKISPGKPNGIKLETFVFDALSLAEKSIILETLRSEEFAPVKNADGIDSPAVTKKMMTTRAANWLKAAGIKIPTKPDGSPDCTIEMAASFALHREDIILKAAQASRINSGDMLYLEN